MYKIVSFRYESVIQKNFARPQIFFCPPPQSQIRSYGLETHTLTWEKYDAEWCYVVKCINIINSTIIIDGPSKKNKKGDDGKTDDNSTKHPEGKKTKTDKRNKSTEDREKQSTVDDNTTEKRAKASNIPKRDEFWGKWIKTVVFVPHGSQ